MPKPIENDIQNILANSNSSNIDNRLKVSVNIISAVYRYSREGLEKLSDNLKNPILSINSQQLQKIEQMLSENQHFIVNDVLLNDVVRKDKDSVCKNIDRKKMVKYMLCAFATCAGIRLVVLGFAFIGVAIH